MPIKKEESEPRVPTDLRKMLATDSSVQALWKGLTPLARRDFILWIEQAKQPETRKRRVESMGSRLVSGKRRPCCFAIVPMNLYKALGAMPKAKAQWGDLSSIERREFVRWIDVAKQPEERRRRVEQVCVMLASGKRQPR
jgi:uncharacterized protein YdeI (YjbR/CyaY-like superfamily)